DQSHDHHLPRKACAGGESSTIRIKAMTTISRGRSAQGAGRQRSGSGPLRSSPDMCLDRGEQLVLGKGLGEVMLRADDATARAMRVLTPAKRGLCASHHTSRVVLRAPPQRGKRNRVLTYRYTPCYAMRVTFFEGRPRFQRLPSPGQTYSRCTEHNRRLKA